MKQRFLNCFLIPGCFLCLLLYLFAFPTQAFKAACDGVDLWFHTLLPSLLPFCILSHIFITTEIIPKLLRPFEKISRNIFGLSSYGTYAVTLGLLCGYPMGAKMVGDLYRQQKINYQEGAYLLTISNHASPMFLSTYIYLHLFQNEVPLSKIFLIMYSSSIFTLFFFRIYFYMLTQHENPYILHATSLDPAQYSIHIETIDEAIFHGFEIITKLGGYIILFSIGSRALQQVFFSFPNLQWFLSGITELTTGSRLIMQSSLPLSFKHTIILTFTAFGGLSTVAQTKGMLHSTPFRISTYILGKIIHALITFVTALLFFVF